MITLTHEICGKLNFATTLIHRLKSTSYITLCSSKTLIHILTYHTNQRDKSPLSQVLQGNNNVILEGLGGWIPMAGNVSVASSSLAVYNSRE